MEEFLKIDRTKQEVELMSPLTWAYIGDAVYELFIRNKLINETNLKPHKLHIEAIKYVKAKSQAEKLNAIYEMLTDEEKDIVRRGRNVQNHHLPKNSNVQEYMYSTAFEALIGYLYLTKQNTRLKEILEKIWFVQLGTFLFGTFYLNWIKKQSSYRIYIILVTTLFNFVKMSQTETSLIGQKWENQELDLQNLQIYSKIGMLKNNIPFT